MSQSSLDLTDLSLSTDLEFDPTTSEGESESMDPSDKPGGSSNFMIDRVYYALSQIINV